MQIALFIANVQKLVFGCMCGICGANVEEVIWYLRMFENTKEWLLKCFVANLVMLRRREVVCLGLCHLHYISKCLENEGTPTVCRTAVVPEVVTISKLKFI